MARDIVVTWPKSRAFSSYMVELERAKGRGLLVSFRVPSRPSQTPERCYRVHDGKVRGWLRVIAVSWSNSVARVPSDPAEGYWPPGVYVTCDPEWHELRPHVEMQGFRGWRWFERPVRVA